MIDTTQHDTKAPDGQYRFSGSDLAAIRLVELLTTHPIVAEILNSSFSNQDSWQQSLKEFSWLINDEKAREDFLNRMKDRLPLEDLKKSMTEFISENFSQAQIEYAISLILDPRLKDLASQAQRTVIEETRKALTHFEQIFHQIDQLFTRPPDPQ